MLLSDMKLEYLSEQDEETARSLNPFTGDICLIFFLSRPSC